MHKRCYKPQAKDYKHYGGRGITVADRWSFTEIGINNFIEDMLDSYTEGLEIDRIDVNGNYEPGNVRWVTRKENVWNRRAKEDGGAAHMETFNGETKCLAEWAVTLGIPSKTLGDRLVKLKWSVEKAFTTPLRAKYIKIKIGETFLTMDDIFVHPENIYAKAKKIGISASQFTANILDGIGEVYVLIEGEELQISPNDVLCVYTQKNITEGFKAVLDKLKVNY